METDPLLDALLFVLRVEGDPLPACSLVVVFGPSNRMLGKTKSSSSE
jgi:hypothetical protein